ncbi:flagellar basal-body rod protein FlgG [Mariniblastus sp.]|jgi:flagellar basal-body rod protein FlgG|nr:flagellar basal-body rod protein FlgG [bacterium]MDA7902023.1 flagellar basal-body rod protein FlgG [Mariniblastus sp.]MDA7887441.1 flagellar basal-body rod protein FlgG [bacterium]MDA7901968.1 flagellar basal-body rod protein FlgG [bacterium]MDA7924758.1 flagellar basal-body rod protein FlgG [Mariniblastus sp.]
MLKAFFTSATGMRAQELLIDNTANNLANVNTTGFKKSHVEFSDLIYDVSKVPGAPIGDGQVAPIGLQIGNGVRATGTTNVFTQGAPIEDGIDTHMAIKGEGFFKVIDSGSLIGYTRDGSFTQNAFGELVNSQGYRLDPGITIPNTGGQISISNSGVVSIQQQGEPEPVELGQIQLFRFANPTGLRQAGGNLYEATQASGQEIAGTPSLDGFGNIQSRSLESSNVEVVSEMVSLITAQRAYEINSRAIKAGDEMLSTTAQIVR